MMEYLAFYKSQILLGVISGSAVSLAGVFVIVRRMVFFGFTLSQAATFAFTLVLFLGEHSSTAIFLLSVATMMPLYFLIRTDSRTGKEVILASGFVVFSAMSSIMLSLGGNAKNHLVSAFFGDVLMIDPGQWAHSLPWVVFALLGFLAIYRPLLSVTVDADAARLSGIPVQVVEFSFFVILAILLGSSIQFLGAYHTMAQLILPPLFGLFLARSVRGAILFSILYSPIAILLGFLLSFYAWPSGEETYHMPASSSIVLVLALGPVITGIALWSRRYIHTNL